ncbi:MAG: efflux RND transporter periplasmic adaptor subunit [Thermoguttaceae bacterium]|jgi:HlyD family secretion protein
MVVAATFGFLLVRASADEPKPAGVSPGTLRTATVTRGDLAEMVNATGTMEPEEVVDVGSQVTGVVASLGADPQAGGKSIDYNSRVEAGTLLAQIDDTVYASAVEQARAGCMRADAELAQAKVRLGQAKVDWQRAEELFKKKAIAQSDFDLAKYNFEMAQASIGVAEANSVQSKAVLKLAEANLGYTRIRSPVKGVIVSRRVNVGQTVAANLNAASMFLIAKDLKNLQVWVSVNEADIGKIRQKQAARFTVDAYPGKSFEGKVVQIRLNAQMTQNVVTYTVVVAVDNADEKLLPYLTASVQFEAGRRKDVLLVPNAALRWRPQPQWILPDAREKSPPGKQKARRVWVQDGKFVRPIAVETGLTDGVMTEIGGDDVTEGMKVITGGSIATTEEGSQRGTNSPGD